MYPFRIMDELPSNRWAASTLSAFSIRVSCAPVVFTPVARERATLLVAVLYLAIDRVSPLVRHIMWCRWRLFFLQEE
jgi:hypothetical protein